MSESSKTLPSQSPRVGFCIVLFCTLWFAYVYAHQKYYNRATSVSRLALLHSLFVDRTVCIDAYHERTPDKAIWQGHYYSDKAPGTVVLCVPAFGAAVFLANALHINVDSEAGWLLTSWIACAFSIASVTALGGVACCLWLAKTVGWTAAVISTLGVFLGAAPLPYATMMYSHAFVVGLISVALWAIDLKPISNKSGFIRAFWPELVAGFSLGFALASEFTAGLVIVGVGVYGLRRKGWRCALRASAASIPPLLLIPLYNFLCFGSPLRLGYAHQATFEQMRHGLFGIQWPNLGVAFNLLFPPSRGLFFWTPFLILAVFGYGKLYRVSRPGFWLAFLVPTIQVLVISGYVWDWPAGWVLGPRYLAPMLPLMALPAALVTEKHPFVGGYLAWISILLTGLATHIDATPPAMPEVSNPLLEIYIPAFFQGDYGYNIGKLCGLGGHASLVFYLVIVVFLIYRLYVAAVEMDRETEATKHCP